MTRLVPLPWRSAPGRQFTFSACAISEAKMTQRASASVEYPICAQKTVRIRRRRYSEVLVQEVEADEAEVGAAPDHDDRHGHHRHEELDPAVVPRRDVARVERQHEDREEART